MKLRYTCLALALVLLVAGCGDAADDGADEDRRFPSSATSAWLAGIDDSDMARVADVVEPVSLAIVVAFENGLDAVQTLALIEDGMPQELASGYWQTFGAEFSEFSGRALSGMAVGDFEELPGGEYAVVDLGLEGGASNVIVVKAEDGWRVDMVATLGAGIVGPLRRMFEELPPSEEGDAVRTAFRETVVPALGVIAERTPEPSLAADAEQLVTIIESYIP